jgi:hypothetical protein
VRTFKYVDAAGETGEAMQIVHITDHQAPRLLGEAPNITTTRDMIPEPAQFAAVDNSGESFDVIFKEVKSEQRITRLWTALSATRDFRPSEWKAVDTGGAGMQRAFEAQPPHTGYAAVFAEMEFGEGSTAYTLCTPIRVLAAKDAPLATKTR